MKTTSEKAFEVYIHETMSVKGWTNGDVSKWDKQRAIFPEYILSFIKTTQSDLWQQMEKLHGAELPNKLIDAIVKERNIKDTLNIIRHGFKFYGKLFRLSFFKPAHGLVFEIEELYQQNILHVTRQVPCHPEDNSTIDMLLSLNGIPIATIEIKNPGSGQTWKNAVNQYMFDRSYTAPLFKFKKGAVVHFAIDPDEIHMTTHLRGIKTMFLPFNRGSHPGEVICGAGNPQHPSGHRTAYFWEDIFNRDSFLDIVSNFIFLEKKEDTEFDESGKRVTIKKETLVFPRYHQLDAVRKLVTVTRVEGSGNNYLIQHSAGSGKTNSISWLSHRLSSLHTKDDVKVFDGIVVITDRKVLDQQLQDAIYQIEHAQGVVQAIDENSRQLADALVDGTKIIVTTLQKFPFILQGLLHKAGAEDLDNPDERAILAASDWQKKIAARKYAIIVDEAHSSQTGETARELKQILGAGSGSEKEYTDMDWEDGLNRIMESRGKQKNLSFFAFTATPKGKTIELFGRKGDSGKPESFHIYSMRQAIEECFILDVLKQYTTYKTYFNLIKKVEDDPKMPKKRAAKKLAKFLSLHPHNIEQKTEVIIEHFRRHIKSKLNNRSKAMVVTESRLSAVRYMLSFQKYIAENNYTDIRPLVALSGTVTDKETQIDYTEPSMNIDVVTGKTISEAQLKDKFNTADYQILLVANKYQTGYDQPLLCAMYVDKRLDGVQAVQTLSRLNRIYPGKESPFILDFRNEAEGILEAFKPYYNVTTLIEPSDPTHLEELKHELDKMQVYLQIEVGAFSAIFYKPNTKQVASDHAGMQKYLQLAVDRFKELEEEHQVTFYEKITAYVKFYAFVSQIMPYTDQELEMMYSYSRFLIPHLHINDVIVNPNPEKDVELEYYRLQKIMEGSIDLSEGEIIGVSSPTVVGTGKVMDEDKPLSEIIKALNDSFGTDFSDEDRLFFEQIKDKALKDERIIQTARANSLDKFELGIKQIIESLMMQRMAENDSIVTRYMDDPEFQKTIFGILAKEIYQDVMKEKII